MSKEGRTTYYQPVSILTSFLYSKTYNLSGCTGLDRLFHLNSITFHDQIPDGNQLEENFTTIIQMLKRVSGSGKLNHVVFRFLGWAHNLYETSRLLLKASAAAVTAANVVGLRSVHVHVELLCPRVASRDGKLAGPDPFAGGLVIAIPRDLARIGLRFFVEYVNAYILIIYFNS